MLQHIVQLVIFAIAVLAAARIVPGIHVRSFGAALVFSLVFAVVDKLLYGVLVFLSLPAVVLTFGLFLLVINAFLFWLSDKLTPGMKVNGFLSALAGSVITSVVSSLLLWAIR